jgi:hypothetical protein
LQALQKTYSTQRDQILIFGFLRGYLFFQMKGRININKFKACRDAKEEIKKGQ